MNHNRFTSVRQITGPSSLMVILTLAALCHSTLVSASSATVSNPVHVTRPTAASASPAATEPASAASGADTAEAPPIISIKSAVAKQLREAIEKSNEAAGIKKKPNVVITTSSKSAAAHGPAEAPGQGHAGPAEAKAKSAVHRSSAKAAHKASASHDAHAAPHWSYEGETGPQAWGQLEPAFNICAIGKRQSPIHIEEATTLQGPAEPLQINYLASKGSVVNNGHTIQVDLEGENTLTVRGSTYKLVQFHFHHPAEERVNYKGFSMVAHLVHKNDQGQLAVLAVLFDPGEANLLIQKVWTHMPLDVNDRVSLPDGLIDVNEALPKDRRYYQFIGSLTTPPCTEGVLWMVLKEPMTLSREQLKLFSQLFPMNARPVQPSFGRVVREAQ
jgi:carbonic anhydrase